MNEPFISSCIYFFLDATMFWMLCKNIGILHQVFQEYFQHKMQSLYIPHLPSLSEFSNIIKLLSVAIDWPPFTIFNVISLD